MDAPGANEPIGQFTTPLLSGPVWGIEAATKVVCAGMVSLMTTLVRVSVRKLVAVITKVKGWPEWTGLGVAVFCIVSKLQSTNQSAIINPVGRLACLR